MKTTAEYRRLPRATTLFTIFLIAFLSLPEVSGLRAQGCGASSSLIVGHARAATGTVAVDLRGSSRCRVNGFGLAIGHDPSQVRFLEAEPGPFLMSHAGRDLFVFYSADNEQGFMALLVAFDLSFPLTVPATTIPGNALLATLLYEIVPGAEPGEVVLRNEDETFGDPPVANIFTTERLEIRPVLRSGSITILEDERPRFSRGDVDGNGRENLSDAGIVILHLFSGGPEPLCMKAADSDDNGTVNLSDAIHLLNYLFLSGDPPPAPLGECGPDPTEDDLTCLSFPRCQSAED